MANHEILLIFPRGVCAIGSFLLNRNAHVFVQARGQVIIKNINININMVQAIPSLQPRWYINPVNHFSCGRNDVCHSGLSAFIKWTPTDSRNRRCHLWGQLGSNYISNNPTLILRKSKIRLEYCRTAEIILDVLTKPLTETAIKRR